MRCGALPSPIQQHPPPRLLYLVEASLLTYPSSASSSRLYHEPSSPGSGLAAANTEPPDSSTLNITLPSQRPHPQIDQILKVKFTRSPPPPRRSKFVNFDPKSIEKRNDIRIFCKKTYKNLKVFEGQVHVYKRF